jgi:hypothetical protein
MVHDATPCCKTPVALQNTRKTRPRLAPAVRAQCEQLPPPRHACRSRSAPSQPEAALAVTDPPSFMLLPTLFSTGPADCSSIASGQPPRTRIATDQPLMYLCPLFLSDGTISVQCTNVALATVQATYSPVSRCPTTPRQRKGPHPSVPNSHVPRGAGIEM